jgi:hypothetical protein
MQKFFSFFDYVYFTISKFYSNYEKAAETSALLILTLMQVFDISIIYFLICLFLHKNYHANALPSIILYIIILMLNGRRYNKMDFNLLSERCEKDKYANRKGILAMSYIVGSTILFLGLAAYLGNKGY